MLPHPLLVLSIAISIAIILIPIRLIERADRLRRVQLINQKNWVRGTKNVSPRAAEDFKKQQKISKQDSFDYSRVYLSSLKGALANPSEKSLKKFANILYDDRNLANQLWNDMNADLSEIHKKYSIEFEAITSKVIGDSSDYVQLYSIQKLLKGRTIRRSSASNLLDRIANHPIWRNIYNTSGH
jgi:hypothetical protein